MEAQKKTTVSKNPIMVLLYSALLFFACQMLGTLLVQPLSSYFSSETIMLAAYSLASLAVLLLILQFDRNQSLWQKTGLRPTKAKNFLLVLPVLAVYVFVSFSLTGLISFLISGFNANQAQDVGLPSTLSGLSFWAAFFSLVVLTPIFEEVIFRGVLFRGLRDTLKFWPSALLTSLVFAAAHAQWNVSLDTFVLSIALCYLLEKSESVLPGIVLHAAKNSLAFVLLFVIK